MDKTNFEKLIKRKAENEILDAQQRLIKHMDQFLQRETALQINGGWHRITEKVEFAINENYKTLVENQERRILNDVFIKIKDLKYLFEERDENN